MNLSGTFPASLFFIFVFSAQLLKQLIVNHIADHIISVVGSNYSINCATTTALNLLMLITTCPSSACSDPPTKKRPDNVSRF